MTHDNVPQHRNTRFLWPIRAHFPNGISMVQLFSHGPQRVPMDAPSPLKVASSHVASGRPSNTWFPGPTRVLSPNSNWIGAAVFAGLTSVTDRPTDRPRYSIVNNKGKERKEVYLYSAFIVATTLKALRRGSHSFTCK